MFVPYGKDNCKISIRDREIRYKRKETVQSVLLLKQMPFNSFTESLLHFIYLIEERKRDRALCPSLNSLA